jgi:tRNA pseudouridine38-40 synthase
MTTDSAVEAGLERTMDSAADKAKSGSFSLEEVMKSEDFSRKFKTAETKKRKWALNFGYLGSQYQGLQMNPNANTVEKHLERALYLAGTISDSNFADLHKIQWTRTARTDRGVHAVMQCCAMKLLVSLDERENFIKNMNSFLPSDIKIHSLSKVSKGFNSKLQCTKRRYHYILPTYLLQDTSIVFSLLDNSLSIQGKITDAGLSGGYADLGSNRFLGGDALRTARESLKILRLDSSRLANFRAALKRYEGTHKYHNFTTDKHPSDASSSRYVLSFTCGEPFIDAASESEWISLSVVGQSFLLNQIRKMIGLACDVAAGRTTITTLTDAMSDKKVSQNNITCISMQSTRFCIV